MQFFDTLTTIIAQKFDPPAQIADRPFFDFSIFFDFFCAQKGPFGVGGNKKRAQFLKMSVFFKTTTPKGLFLCTQKSKKSKNGQSAI